MTKAGLHAQPSPAPPENPSQRLKILFTEGSSTSARQSLYALGRLGHTIDLCDSQRLCLGRFSRYVRRWHHAPPFAAKPAEYLAFLEGLLAAEHYDVLFPVHDQVLLLSRFRERLGRLTGLALPAFQSLRRLQSKIEFVRLLDELGLPQPTYAIVEGAPRVPADWPYPFFVKQEYSTAGCGVWKVDNAQELRALVERLKREGHGDQTLLAQQPAQGEYGVVQAVFQQGRLVGAHCYRSRAAGVGGSAQARLGVVDPAVIEQVSRLGARLDWHGALHAEFFQDASGRAELIEANPRIGETMNATLSGVNLCELLMQVSLGQTPGDPPAAQSGVRTHSILMGLLAAAQAGANRRALLAELWRACNKRGIYADSQDELTRPRDDAWSLLPALFVTGRLLLNPRLAQRMVEQAVENYSASEAAVRDIEKLSPERDNA